ncbi:MAG: hypothetical protein J6R99_03350, partial [Alphaproteobacteria bacterium]|nr:hypothetical protein [Alphaproteobacteria bacterium]
MFFNFIDFMVYPLEKVYHFDVFYVNNLTPWFCMGLFFNRFLQKILSVVSQCPVDGIETAQMQSL